MSPKSEKTVFNLVRKDPNTSDGPSALRLPNQSDRPITLETYIYETGTKPGTNLKDLMWMNEKSPGQLRDPISFNILERFTPDLYSQYKKYIDTNYRTSDDFKQAYNSNLDLDAMNFYMESETNPGVTTENTQFESGHTTSTVSDGAFFDIIDGHKNRNLAADQKPPLLRKWKLKTSILGTSKAVHNRVSEDIAHDKGKLETWNFKQIENKSDRETTLNTLYEKCEAISHNGKYHTVTCSEGSKGEEDYANSRFPSYYKSRMNKLQLATRPTFNEVSPNSADDKTTTVCECGGGHGKPRGRFYYKHDKHDSLEKYSDSFELSRSISNNKLAEYVSKPGYKETLRPDDINKKIKIENHFDKNDDLVFSTVVDRRTRVSRDPQITFGKALLNKHLDEGIMGRLRKYSSKIIID